MDTQTQADTTQSAVTHTAQQILKHLRWYKNLWMRANHRNNPTAANDATALKQEARNDYMYIRALGLTRPPRQAKKELNCQKEAIQQSSPSTSLCGGLFCNASQPALLPSNHASSTADPGEAPVEFASPHWMGTSTSCSFKKAWPRWRLFRRAVRLEFKCELFLPAHQTCFLNFPSIRRWQWLGGKKWHNRLNSNWPTNYFIPLLGIFSG